MVDGIVIENLTKRYAERTVVDDVSVHVDRGEIVALLGRNGAGKTTTVECAVGFRTPDAGHLRVLGADPVRDRDQVVPHLGVMLQEGGAYPAATPREMLRLYAALYPNPRSVEGLVELLELGPRADDRFRTLSGGEKQRVNLALALVGRPLVAFLDEPTAGMDAAARHRTWEVIDLLRGTGAAILLTTHHLDEAERLADRVAIIDRGRLLVQDTPAALTAGDERIVVTSPAEVDVGALAAGVGARARRDGASYVVSAGAERVAAVTAWFAEQGLPVTGVTTHRRSLEDVFLELTRTAP